MRGRNIISRGGGERVGMAGSSMKGAGWLQRSQCSGAAVPCLTVLMGSALPWQSFAECCLITAACWGLTEPYGPQVCADGGAPSWVTWEQPWGLAEGTLPSAWPPALPGARLHRVQVPAVLYPSTCPSSEPPQIAR